MPPYPVLNIHSRTTSPLTLARHAEPDASQAMTASMSEGGPRQAPPASEAAVRGLKRFDWVSAPKMDATVREVGGVSGAAGGAGGASECSICLQNYEKGYRPLQAPKP